jgi:uncharacterized membrane protein
MTATLLIVFYFTFPAFILYLCKRLPVLNKLGAILLAYAAGLLIGNIGILPETAPDIINTIITICIPLALPLLLYSSKLDRWSKLAGRTFLSMILAFVALLVIVFSGFYLFGNKIENAWQVAGMAVGVYSGGTPNMAAIAVAINVENELYIMTHTSDMVVGAICLFFFLSVAQRVFLLFLPKFRLPQNGATVQTDTELDFESYDGIFTRRIILHLLKALGITILVVAVGGALSLIVPKKYEMATVILSITSLGMLLSLVPKVRKLEKTFQLGMYFILIFSLAVASLGDLSKLLGSSPYIFYYIAYAVFGTLILHLLLSAIFRIDADTTIITQIAFIMSPPFVPVAAAALKNRDVIISGILVGIIGYAIGNYLGVMIAFMLE